MDVTRSPLTRSQRALLALACSLAVAAPAAAQSPDAIQTLLERGQYDKAAETSAAYLEDHPDATRVRFQRGLALAELGRREEAIEAFGELARAYPQAPEPANNLAVLYAQQGDYEKARRWLEAAMATHPAYATAHKNLGDVYTALAAAAYSKALDEQDRADLGVELEYVGEMGVEQDDGGDGTRLAASDGEGRMRSVPAPEPAPEPARPPQPEPAQPEPAPQPASEPASEDGAPAGGGDAATLAPAAPDDTDAGGGPVGPTSGRAGEVMRAVRAWARAWEAQDVAGYLDAYAENFYPGDGLTLAEWRAQRRDRVGSPADIAIEISEPSVTFPEPGRAEVVFQQAYSSETYSDRVRKRLVLERKDDAWRIVREISE